MINEIDFVILWVDGNDPDWKKEFEKYSFLRDGDKRVVRYRDWDNLKYIFRGFEYFTPWVRKIHFVTCGHLPAWLNTKHKRINIVTHSDFMDAEYLPTFNSHPLEVNIHRIPGLSERFVYFNDDMFILDRLQSERFFLNDLPRDILTFNSIFIDSISHIRLNDILIVNKHFNKMSFVKKHFFKLFNFRYGLEQIRSFLLLPWPQITGFYDPHQPQPFLKKTFEELWNLENDVLEKTTSSRFRSISDVNQYLFRYWQLMKADFIPVSFSDSHTVPVKNMKDIDKTCELIKNKRYRLLCINDEADNFTDEEFEIAKSKLNSSFEFILPDKSSFEL